MKSQTLSLAVAGELTLNVDEECSSYLILTESTNSVQMVPTGLNCQRLSFSGWSAPSGVSNLTPNVHGPFMVETGV